MELFRLKIGAKRQVTIPQHMLNALGLREGDELQVKIEDAKILSVEACKIVPSYLFTPEILAALKQREREFDTGGGQTYSAKPVVTFVSHGGS